jgi:hypothetical protein
MATRGPILNSAANTPDRAWSGPDPPEAAAPLLSKDNVATLQRWLRGTGAVHDREAGTDLISDHKIDH